MSDFEMQIKKIENLKPDWDSYGAEPPHEKAITHARYILEKSLSIIQPQRIIASVEGGVGLVFQSEHGCADIECLNDGTIMAAIKRYGDTPDFRELTCDDSEINIILQDIKRALAGS